MKFEISRSLKGGKLIYIARDHWGVVRLRENTMKKMEDAVERFNKMELSGRANLLPQKNEANEWPLEKPIIVPNTGSGTVGENLPTGGGEESKETGEETKKSAPKTKPSAIMRKKRKPSQNRQKETPRKFSGYKR